jgi:NAD(P)-dependent dehydrogenase (short-subunit alcohol dehydrogenase family)
VPEHGRDAEAVGAWRRAVDRSLAQWQRVIAVNLTGVWLSCRAAIRQFVAQGSAGTIVATASVGGLVGVPNIAPYAASKAGVIGLTRQIAVDYGPQGIRMNAICPGTIPTPLVRRSYEERIGVPAGEERSVDELLTESLRARFPLRRLGTERDVADAAVYLASDESAWVTGTVLVVDGGLTAS